VELIGPINFVDVTVSQEGHINDGKTILEGGHVAVATVNSFILSSAVKRKEGRS
jgi:hypothetical protein